MLAWLYAIIVPDWALTWDSWPLHDWLLYTRGPLLGTPADRLASTAHLPGCGACQPAAAVIPAAGCAPPPAGTPSTLGQPRHAG